MGLLKMDSDSAQVRFPPPLIELINILAGILFNLLWPVQFVPEYLKWPLGSTFITLGIGIILSSFQLFKKDQTNIEPWKSTSHMITRGIYGFSRNPIYLSFVFIGLGIAFVSNNLWIALMQIFVVLIIERYVIKKEEQYLESKFGNEYRNYRSNVRRWI